LNLGKDRQTPPKQDGKGRAGVQKEAKGQGKESHAKEGRLGKTSRSPCEKTKRLWDKAP